MAENFPEFACTLNTGTTPSSPQTIPMNFNPAEVEQIIVRVPPGPRGEVGFAIATGGVWVIPDPTTTWIVENDTELAFPVTNAHNSGSWQLIGYNTGTYPHTLKVMFQTNPPSPAYTSVTPAAPDMTGTTVAQ